MTDPTRRFSNRVSNYAANRPDYPVALFQSLTKTYGLGPETNVADIGAGTGISTRRLLETGARVIAFEPNDKMRGTLDEQLGDHPQLEVRGDRAETLGIGDASVDALFAAQAFHWFDRDRVRFEFRRVLKAAGWCALVWNERDLSSPLIQDYTDVITRLAADDPMPRGDGFKKYNLPEFFAPGRLNEDHFAYSQHHDREGFLGRALSASYVPLPGEPNHDALVDAMHRIFDTHQVDGQVEMVYVTRLFHGRFEQRS